MVMIIIIIIYRISQSLIPIRFYQQIVRIKLLRIGGIISFFLCWICNIWLIVCRARHPEDNSMLQTQHNFCFVNFLRTVSIIIWQMTTEETSCRTRWPFFSPWILIYVPLFCIIHSTHLLLLLLLTNFVDTIVLAALLTEKRQANFCFNHLFNIHCSEIIYRCILIYCTLAPFLLKEKTTKGLCLNENSPE